jgi:hypothetical protein
LPRQRCLSKAIGVRWRAWVLRGFPRLLAWACASWLRSDRCRLLFCLQSQRLDLGRRHALRIRSVRHGLQDFRLEPFAADPAAGLVAAARRKHQARDADLTGRSRHLHSATVGRHFPAADVHYSHGVCARVGAARHGSRREACVRSRRAVCNHWRLTPVPAHHKHGTLHRAPVRREWQCQAKPSFERTFVGMPFEEPLDGSVAGRSP